MAAPDPYVNRTGLVTRALTPADDSIDLTDSPLGDYAFRSPGFSILGDGDIALVPTTLAANLWPYVSDGARSTVQNSASTGFDIYDPTLSTNHHYSDGYRSALVNPQQAATVTFTNGSAVIGWASNSLEAGTPIVFTTTGGLPTNFTAGTTYYVIATGLSTSQLQVSATPGGAAIVAGSAGSGVHTATASSGLITLNGFGAYIQNNSVTSSTSGLLRGASTGFFANMISAVDGAKSWGAALAMNDLFASAATADRELNGIEIDFTVHSNNGGTHVQGVTVITNAPNAAITGNVFQIGIASGSVGKPDYGFVANNNAVTKWGFVGSTAASGTSISSQQIDFAAFDSGGTARSDYLRYTYFGTSFGYLNFSAAIAGTGIVSRSGTTGSYQGNQFNFQWNGSAPILWVDASNLGQIALLGTAQTWTAAQAFPASTTSRASIRAPHGSAPTSPVDGDIWTTTAGLFVQINGVTKTVTLT